VDTTKAEDMRVQHRRRSHTRRRQVAIITDLPDSVLDRHGIALVPLQVMLTPRPRAVRFGVAQPEAPAAAHRIRAALIETYQPRDRFVSLATGVLGTRDGPGAWGIFYQVEDGGGFRQE